MTQEIELQIQSGKIRLPLKVLHRDAMIDLILAWATLDVSLTILISALTGEELHQTADRIGRNKASLKFLEIAKILEGSTQTAEYAKNFKKTKKRYEKFSVARDRIAHSYCAGYLLSDENYIIFIVAERVGKDLMAVEAISIDEVKAATRFGKMLRKYVDGIAEGLQFAGSKSLSRRLVEGSSV